jgi:predicted ATPase
MVSGYEVAEPLLHPRGVPLATLLRGGPIELERCLRLAIRLSCMLAELHKRGSVHGRINPGSIFVYPDADEADLVDLHLCARSASEAAASFPPELLGATLPYVSPEQTGRMNRTTDYRTDFYSLGVTLYELLTRQLPHRADSALELIHAHIAKVPAAPVDIDPTLPQPISDIVMKLLAKTAEDRYQSALGLRADLELCLRDWAARRQIAPLTPGAFDVPDRFLIPQKLYGRQAEVAALARRFDEACRGRFALCLVAGYSGIGKTSLIQELYGPIARKRGYFISGKFDQVVRNVPFGALVQALRDLVRQLLRESEEQLDAWRKRLSHALGANGGVLSEVIPEIEWIVGPQAAPPELGASEALNRFQLVFQNFLGVLARPEHPLVVFLDDLQWADTATLSLLLPLLTSPDVRCLFLIGAYRDNELDSSHPLVSTLSRIEAATGAIERISLGPLGLHDLSALVRDALRCDDADAEPLAALVQEKTAGNPFFVTQFLKALAEGGLVEFDYATCRWRYRIADIRAARMTDNVIELMAHKLDRLSLRTRSAVTLAACVGNPFDTATLAIVSEQSLEGAEKDLQEAIVEGLLLASTSAYEGPESGSTVPVPANTYAWLHDRVQQAAYALIPDEHRAGLHLRVGRLLLARADFDRSDDRLFDIAHHLNIGSSAMSDGAERLALARLDLRAGRKAKASTASETALELFVAGMAVLPLDSWLAHYELRFALELEAAECQYRLGRFDEAERSFEALLAQARSELDKARVHNLRMVQYENLSRYAEALGVARESLALFGVVLPDSTGGVAAALEAEIRTIEALLEGRSIASLAELPDMTAPDTRMLMSILTDIWSPAYILGDAPLARLISATLVRLSLTHGNVEESAYGYVTHAITVGPIRGDYASAYELGLLALAVNERFDDKRRRAKIHQQFHAHVSLWRRGFETCIAHAREACRAGLASGDFLYAAYGASTESWPAMLATRDLGRFLDEYTPNVALIERLKIRSFADALRLVLGWAHALRGETRSPTSLSSDSFDESAYVEAYADHPFFISFYHTLRLQLCYLFDEQAAALEAREQARALAHHVTGTIWPVLVDFWGGLAIVATLRSRAEGARAEPLEELDAGLARLARLAENCPENYGCPWLLLSAELERSTGSELVALSLYEQAVSHAEKWQQPLYRALGNELAAKLWLARGQARIAGSFLCAAHAAYAEVGARAKLAELGRRYPQLVAGDATPLPSAAAAPGIPGVGDAGSGALDLTSVMKAAQVIAGEIESDKLLVTLLRLAIENAGAERGCLVIEHEREPLVYSSNPLSLNTSRLPASVPLRAADVVPSSVVNYVRRTLDPVVLADARQDARYQNDPYVQREGVRSVLCIPVLNQGRSGGVLYLENRIVTGAFTPERSVVCRMLAAQAVIALENARLYEEMREEATRRRDAEQTLRSVVEGTSAVTGGDFFASLVRHLAAALGVPYAFAASCVAREQSRARTLAFWKRDRLAENFSYDIAETPCQNVLAGELCYYPEHIQQFFPKDRDLLELGAESYLGVPVHDAAGRVIGHLAVLDSVPMPQTPSGVSLLKIFAARAGAELERQQGEEELREAVAKVEQLQSRLQAENVYLQEEIRREHNFEEIVGGAPALLALLEEVRKVAPTDSTVLIQGETGTGKEMIARAVHSRSGRRHRPLVKVNCGAISAGLVESELFGHVRGAFTGALDRRTGRFELADGGTLFLDEVGELPLETQVKLLRVLQEGEFEPVGSSKTLSVDVRIIAATNRQLERSVQEGRFRADLFYRLNVLPIVVPPLRERRSDIVLLVQSFVLRFSKKLGKHIERVSPETLERLLAYDWPGNVRELQNVIERGVVLSQGTTLSLGRDLFSGSARGERDGGESPIAERSPPPPDSSAAPSVPDAPLDASLHTLMEMQRRHIQAALERTRGVIEGPRGAAKLLDLHPNTLRSRMKKLGLR